VGTVDGTATEGDLTVHVTGEFIIDKRAPTGEVSETICD
jgi:hypothetical protein